VFRPGSTAPAAILADAYGAFLAKSPAADGALRALRPALAAAVDACVAAAGHAWAYSMQRADGG
jgi:hypothetical protein